ncbi:MAG: glycosyltransferase family 39 protein [Candidatus Hydrogenedentes bacterium]|nr:glycosyltransferase family 39 protein [Candidatus Hydrogenedentota bacterium]
MRPLQPLIRFARELHALALAPLRPAPPALARWEWAAIGLLAATALAFGLPNLGVPSLWHDELVHLYVAKNIAEVGWPALPSGNVYPSSTAYNYLLAAFVALLGDSEVAARFPSVLLAACNTLLVYFLARVWLGRPVALLAALLFATSPWQVAWSRQARMYELQVTAYLAFLYCAWRYFAGARASAPYWGLGAVAAYLLGLLTSFHSILFLGAPGLFALGLGWRDRRRDTRWAWALTGCAALGAITIIALWLNPNPVDRAAVFQTGLGGTLLDQLRTDRYYYVRFFANNLSIGYLAVAILGAALLLWRRDRASIWVLLGFFVPLFVLTYLIGYRRFRFIFFAYPLYVMLGSCGLLALLGVLRGARRSLLHGLCAALIVIFLSRLAWSSATLLGDSLEAARGAHTTLAVRHPQWKLPTRWVRERRQPGEAVLTTTFLPVHHYVGHVDNWFPNRYTRWEYQESGLEGLDSLEALKAFLADHPRGYFIAEASRFLMWRHHGALVKDLGREVDWVETHMTRIDEACSDDVTVWRWDFLRDDGAVEIP